MSRRSFLANFVQPLFSRSSNDAFFTVLSTTLLNQTHTPRMGKYIPLNCCGIGNLGLSSSEQLLKNKRKNLAAAR
jgi:hypothetical protein